MNDRIEGLANRALSQLNPKTKKTITREELHKFSAIFANTLIEEVVSLTHKKENHYIASFEDDLARCMANFRDNLNHYFSEKQG